MNNKNESAFPYKIGKSTISEQISHGLTKREYAAIHILAGLLAAYSAEGVSLPSDDTAAKIAVDYADALFKKL